MFGVVEETEATEEDEDVEVEEVKDDGWGWTGVIFNLCKDDITKLDEVVNRNIIEVLNWLTFNKQKIDKQNNINAR